MKLAAKLAQPYIQDKLIGSMKVNYVNLLAPTFFFPLGEGVMRLLTIAQLLRSGPSLDLLIIKIMFCN